MLEIIDTQWTKGEHIYFCNLGTMVGAGNKPRLTNIYEILTEHNDKIGEIRWFSRWRKYCFYPWTETIYEETCLRDIAEFIELQTKQHRANKTKAKAAG